MMEKRTLHSAVLFCNTHYPASVSPPIIVGYHIKTPENIFQTLLPKKIVLLVGSEISGIDSWILDKCHKIVHIPLLGNNTSLNVSHALAVALFEWQRQIIH
jgi:tRNA G18 (ribose-2'-O)-methylase SpoU